MLKTKIKINSKTLFISLISFFLVVSIGYAAEKVFNIYGNYLEAPDNGNNLNEADELAFGGVTNFDSLTLSDDLVVDKTTTLTGTTTISRSLDGFIVSGNLSTATGTATTTRNFAVQNTGKDLLCDGVTVNITAGAEYFGSSFSVSTSTWFEKSDLRSLIASTTVATNTTPILSWDMNKGSNVSAPWLWKNADYISGLWDKDSNGLEVNTSTDKDDFAGNYHINCWAY